MSQTAVYQRLINDASLIALVPASDIYSRFLPESATGPAISFFVVSAPPLNHLTGEVSGKNYNYQFDIWSKRLLGAELITEALKTALVNGSDFKSIRISEQHDYEDGPELHRVSLDYSFWF